MPISKSKPNANEKMSQFKEIQSYLQSMLIHSVHELHKRHERKAVSWGKSLEFLKRRFAPFLACRLLFVNARRNGS